MGKIIRAAITLWAALLTFTPTLLSAQPSTDYDSLIRQMGLVDIQSLDSEIMVELRYATTNNFMQQNIYGTLRKAYFLPHFARKVAQAQELLRQRHPEYRLLIYDAARPRSAQRRMRQAVKAHLIRLTWPMHRVADATIMALRSTSPLPTPTVAHSIWELRSTTSVARRGLATAATPHSPTSKPISHRCNAKV